MRRLGVLVLLMGCAAPAGNPAAIPTRSASMPAVRTTPPPAARGSTLVGHVDGDTLDVRIGGTLERVRLIGIDTPERGQRGYAQAAAFTARAAPAGSRVWLTFDVERRDRYGRLLAYVWLRAPGDPERDMLNARLAASGWAAMLTIPPNVEHAELFLRLTRRARERGLGIWVPLPAGAACDPSYPDVCIRPLPPDLDCADVPHRNFAVRGVDPHRFDADRNGRGCETG